MVQLHPIQWIIHRMICRPWLLILFCLCISGALANSSAQSASSTKPQTQPPAKTLPEAPVTAARIDDAETLQSLLERLRAVRRQAQVEKEAWAREQGDLKIMLAQMAARQTALGDQCDRIQQSVDALKADLKTEARKKEVLDQQLDLVRTWLTHRIGQFKQILNDHPLLGDAGIRQAAARMAGKTDAGQDPSRLAADFWALVLKTAAQAVRTSLYAEEMLVGGKEREVTVLKLGAACAIFITHDETRCGLADVVDGAIVWKVLSTDFLADVRQAMQVSRKAVPAEVIKVPVPVSRVVKEKDGEKP